MGARKGALALLTLVVAGCGPLGEGRGPRVLTGLDRNARSQVEASFREAVPDAPQIVWLLVDEEGPVLRVAKSRGPEVAVLGDESAHRELFAAGLAKDEIVRGLKEDWGWASFLGAEGPPSEMARALVDVIAHEGPERDLKAVGPPVEWARLKRDLVASWGRSRGGANMSGRPLWPPASVERAGSGAAGLAEGIAPDDRSSTALLALWEGPSRTTDDALLLEVAKANGGALAREPRFRAWLRAEWGEWARREGTR